GGFGGGAARAPLGGGRIAARSHDGAASAAAVEPWLVALAESVVSGVREPLGIVRARAEVLRLAIAEQPGLHELAHDFEVLLERVAEAQRALLSVFALAPDRSARGRIELPAVAADAVRAGPGASPPPRGRGGAGRRAPPGAVPGEPRRRRLRAARHARRRGVARAPARRDPPAAARRAGRRRRHAPLPARLRRATA